MYRNRVFRDLFFSRKTEAGFNKELYLFTCKHWVHMCKFIYCVSGQEGSHRHCPHRQSNQQVPYHSNANSQGGQTILTRYHIKRNNIRFPFTVFYSYHPNAITSSGKNRTNMSNGKSHLLFLLHFIRTLSLSFISLIRSFASQAIAPNH